MGIVNKIHESYEVIFDLKKEFSSTIIKEVTDVYDNIDFQNIGHGNPINDTINLALLNDVQNAAKAAGVQVSITTARSSHSERTKSGNISRHTPGNAVDISIINGKSVSPSNSTDANKFVDELIKMGYTKNSETAASPKAVLTFGYEGHDDHVHVSNTTNSPSSSSGDTSQTSGSTSTTNTSTQSSSTSADDAAAQDANFAKGIGKSLLNAFGISESKVFSSFGKRTKDEYGDLLIPKDDNEKIKSPVDGQIVNFKYIAGCNNPIAIEFELDGMKYYLLYCGISSPNVRNKQGVSKGTVLGKTDSDVMVSLYDSDKKKRRLNPNAEGKTKDNGKNKTNDNDYKDSIYKSSDNEYTKTLKYLYNKIKTSKDIDTATGRFIEPKLKTEKIQENIERIKTLLK